MQGITGLEFDYQYPMLLNRFHWLSSIVGWIFFYCDSVTWESDIERKSYRANSMGIELKIWNKGKKLVTCQKMRERELDESTASWSGGGN